MKKDSGRVYQANRFSDHLHKSLKSCPSKMTKEMEEKSMEEQLFQKPSYLWCLHSSPNLSSERHHHQ